MQGVRGGKLSGSSVSLRRVWCAAMRCVFDTRCPGPALQDSKMRDVVCDVFAQGKEKGGFDNGYSGLKMEAHKKTNDRKV